VIGPRLVIAEGIETSLAVAMHVKHRGHYLRPVWAMGNANNMRRFPVLKDIAELVICADHDKSGVGRQAADECADRWEAAGRKVEVLMPEKVGTDFNDWIKS
jgi:putative DNA primase/helicase